MKGRPGDGEHCDDGDQHLRRLRLATLRLLDAFSQTAKYPAVERHYKHQRQHELQYERGDAVDAPVVGVRPHFDAVAPVQVEQRIVYDDVARVHGYRGRDGRCEHPNHDDEDEGVGDRHAACCRVQHKDVAIDGDHRETERARVDDDGEEQREDAAQELSEDPVVRELVVSGQRQVDDAHGDVSQSQVGDEHVRRRPHLAGLGDRHNDQGVADDAEQDDDEIKENDDRGEHLVPEYVELTLGRHQGGDVQLVEVTVETLQGQRLAVVAEIVDALEAAEQIERLHVPDVADVAAVRARATYRRVFGMLHDSRPTTETAQ